MNSAGTVLQVVQDVVTGAGDGQDHIIMGNVQKSMVHTRVLPVESIDVLVSKLCVLGEQVIVEDPVVVVLIECRWKRKVRVQVDDG